MGTCPVTADVARSTRTRLVGSWTQSDVSSAANQRGATGSPTWIRPSIFAPAGNDADGDGAALVDAAGDSTTSVELVADTLAEAAGAVSRDDGLAGVAAQAPTEIATMTATLARTTTDGMTHFGLLFLTRSVCAGLGQGVLSPGPCLTAGVAARLPRGVATSRLPAGASGGHGYGGEIRSTYG